MPTTLSTTESTADLYREAVSIIENDIALDDIVKFKHLEAAVEMVEAREALILRLRRLIEELLDERVQNYRSVALTNRAANTLAVTWPEKNDD